MNKTEYKLTRQEILNHLETPREKIEGYQLLVIPQARLRTWGKAIFWGQSNSLPLSQIVNPQEVYIKEFGRSIVVHVKDWIIDVKNLREHVVKLPTEAKNELR